MSTYTQGICGDGAAILKDGKQMTVEEILSELQGPTVVYVALREYDYEGAEVIGVCSTEDAAQKACLEDKSPMGARGDSYSVEGFKLIVNKGD